MKKYALMTAVALILVAPGMAWSQNAPPAGGNGTGGYHNSSNMNGRPENGEQGEEQHFQERKSEILKRIHEHLAEVEQRLHCVEGANNHQALRACMPEQRGGEGQRGGESQGGPQH